MSTELSLYLFKKSFNKYGRSVAYIQGDDYLERIGLGIGCHYFQWAAHEVTVI